MNDSQKLLSEYIRDGSEAAFRELVARYLDLVYSAAIRLVGDAHLAEDISQTVFVDLARLARTLSCEVMLGGWLHRHTCFVAAKTLRGERRRLSREMQAVEMSTLEKQPEAGFSQLAPLLDEAINGLGEEDRKAILLRFFEQHDFRTIGAAIGSNEDAARMRVNRALEKLELLLKRQGVTSAAAALALTLSSHAVQAAPAGLAAGVCSAALTGTSLLTTTIATKTTMNWITIKTTCAIIAAAVAAGTGTYFAQRPETSRLQEENQRLLAQQSSLAKERDKATALAALRNDELERLQKNQTELLRLRGEVGKLRRKADSQRSQTAALTAPQLKVQRFSPHPPGAYIPKSQLANVGYATPEAALETTTWAMMHGTYEDVTKSLSESLLAGESKDTKAKSDFESRQPQMASIFQGMQIVASKTLPNGMVELKVKQDYDKEAFKAVAPQPMPDFMLQPMVKEGEDWKLGGSTHGYDATWDDGQIQNFTQ